MSFKYLNTANNSNSLNQENAAQSFLDDKLAKNKFTIAQEDTGSSFDPSRYTDGQLGELNGNSAPKDFSSQYNKTVTNQDELNTWDATPEYSDNFYEGGWRSGKNSGEVGWSDTWNEGGNFQQIKGSGKQDAAYLSQFDALSKSDSDVDDGGEWRTIKSVENSGGNTRSDMKKLAAEWQSKGFDVRVQDLDNSQGAGWADIAVRKGQHNKGERPEEQIQLDKIEHSPEIKQAKERVQTYENDVLSGKVSEDVYKVGSNDQYTFDATKGAAGIGTPMNGSSLEQADKATASFLDNKKSQVKNQYQFKAQG